MLSIQPSNKLRISTITRGNKNMKDEIYSLHSKYLRDIKDIRTKYEKPVENKIEKCKSTINDGNKQVKKKVNVVMKEICELEIENIKKIIDIISKSNKDNYIVEEDYEDNEHKDDDDHHFDKTTNKYDDVFKHINDIVI